MRDTNYTNKTRKVKSVTRIPSWMLFIKGFVESFWDEHTCETYVERLYEKMNSQMKDEEMAAEKELVVLREEAKGCMEILNKKKEEGEKHLPEEGFSSDAIRKNRRMQKLARAEKEAKEMAKKNLYEIDELIPYIKIIRDDRMEKICWLGEEKIMAYISGVVSGGQKDFVAKPPTKKYENESRNYYLEKQDTLEKKIERLISKGEE